MADRLNALLASGEDIRNDIERLLYAKVRASQATIDHQTIVCGPMWGTEDLGLSFLGLLNGALGGGFIASEWEPRAEGEQDRLIGVRSIKKSARDGEGAKPAEGDRGSSPDRR